MPEHNRNTVLGPSTTPPARRSPIAALLLGVLVIYSVTHFLYSGVYCAFRAPGGDFGTAFPGPLMFRLIQHWPSLAKDWIVPPFVASQVIWNYGPILHFLTLPFVVASTRAQALAIVLCIDYLLAALSFFLWLRLLFGDRPGWGVTLGMACIWLNYYPLLEAIAGREIELLELLLITGAIWALHKQREDLAGAAIGVATMTKFLPVLLIPYLLVKEFRRAFWVAVGTVLAIGVLTQWLLGFEHSLTLKVFAGETGTRFFPATYMRQAIINVVYRMFTRFDMHQPDPTTLYPDVLQPIGMALQVGVLAACSWFIVRWRRTRLMEIEISLLMLIMVLVGPHANTYYFVFALPALSVGFAAWIQQSQRLGMPVKIALVGALILSGFFLPMNVLGRLIGVPGVIAVRILQLYSFPAFGAILAAIAMVGLHQLKRTTSKPVAAWSDRTPTPQLAVSAQ